MRRREFVLLSGSAAVIAASARARSQPTPKRYRIAIVLSTTPVAQINERDHALVGAFLQELRRLSYAEGYGLTVERHSGEGRFESFPDLARSVAETKPDVILGITDAIARALQAATSTIPLVVISSDPVAQGFVKSLAHPGGNITGVTSYAGLETVGKYLEILKEIDPRIRRVGLLAPRTTWGRTYGDALDDAAGRLGITITGCGQRIFAQLLTITPFRISVSSYFVIACVMRSNA